MLKALKSKFKNIVLGTVLWGSIFSISDIGYSQARPKGDFNKYEVRVIRPRYFNKSGKFEFGTQLNAVMNQTFIYSYLASGILTYHFSESLGLEFLGAYGLSMDKQDKETLFSEFSIKVKILRTQYLMDASLLWTPIYGKWQTSKGNVIYFDSYLTGGVGMTGVDWDYNDFCADQTGREKNVQQTASYPTFIVGVGQRIFLSKKTSVKIDGRMHLFSYSKQDSACYTDDVESGSVSHNNTMLQIGWSKYF